MVQSINLAAIDNHFGEFASRLSAGGGENVFLAAALASMATRAGHACLDLSAWAAASVIAADGSSYSCPELALWLAELTSSSAIGSGHDVTPLVLEDDRLYLRRYWEYEDDVAKFVIARGQAPAAEVAMEFLGEAMARLFPAQIAGCDWQRVAALAVILRPFVVITGGPGTGKTTTVARIIALLIEQQYGNENIRIALAAPTGKAVMRLQGVMAGIKKTLNCSERIRARIPTKVTTLHRLLGSCKDSPFFTHDAKNKLPYDLVVVDEASMVDLPLMAKLMRALRPETKLVLLGDRNQLASVEPGAVLGDICGQEAVVRFSTEFLARASAVTSVDGLAVGEDGQADSLVELQVSHRFGVDSGIDLVGQAINRGNGGAALEIFRDDNYPDVVWRDIGSGEQLRRELAGRFNDCPPGWFGIDDPAQVLQSLGSFQVLCAVRQSAFGINQINGYIEEALAEKWGVVSGAGYHGRPVLVVANNYELQLFNGDTGIILADPAKEGVLQAFFPAGEKELRKIPLALLPGHETAYAMTVHKSQGSEFDEVVIILPDWQSAVLSRELLYTALTRARQRVEVWGSAEIFKGTVKAVISRHGGLRDKLRVL
ncbi:MAG: exodeoxyribonuclease V subunit alpha [Thermodesulfobacteriota bacterium]